MICIERDGTSSRVRHRVRLANLSSLTLSIVLISCASLCVAQPQGRRTEIVGCLTRTPANTLQLEARPSGKIYQLHGNISLLQRHVNQLVTIHQSDSAAGDDLNADALSVISGSCTSALPSKTVAAVAGKVGRNVPAPNVTTTLSAGETTPGFQTESDVEQAAGTGAGSPNVRYGDASSPIAPAHAEQAGESEAAANSNAAAAIRAEIYPGNTLGVTVKSMPPSSVQALQTDKKTPQETYEPPKQ